MAIIKGKSLRIVSDLCNLKINVNQSLGLYAITITNLVATKIRHLIVKSYLTI